MYIFLFAHIFFIFSHDIIESTSIFRQENEMDRGQGCSLFMTFVQMTPRLFPSRYGGSPGGLFSEFRSRRWSFGERERNRWASRITARAQLGSLFPFFIFRKLLGRLREKYRETFDEFSDRERAKNYLWKERWYKL